MVVMRVCEERVWFVGRGEKMYEGHSYIMDNGVSPSINQSFTSQGRYTPVVLVALLEVGVGPVAYPPAASFLLLLAVAVVGIAAGMAFGMNRCTSREMESTEGVMTSTDSTWI